MSGSFFLDISYVVFYIQSAALDLPRLVTAFLTDKDSRGRTEGDTVSMYMTVRLSLPIAVFETPSTKVNRV